MSRKTRKLIWSAPLVAVLAVAGALALFVALARGACSPTRCPPRRANLDVEAASGDAGRTTLVLDLGRAGWRQRQRLPDRQGGLGRTSGKPW